MVGDLEVIYDDCGGLGMKTKLDPLQVASGWYGLRAGHQAKNMAGIANATGTDEYIRRLAGLACANAAKRLAEKTRKYTMLEF